MSKLETLAADLARLCVVRREGPKKARCQACEAPSSVSEPATLFFHSVRVAFPFDPLPPQRQVMERVVRAILRREAALLESPTGTGKTAALLCAALAAQNHLLERGEVSKVVYATRTINQARQLAGELKKLPYAPRVATLASRIHYGCGYDRRKCKKLIQAEETGNFGCAKYRALAPVHASDIEDLQGPGCGYFTAKALAEQAHLVLCPYNYVLAPSSRMDDLLKDAIVILDEAHNVEGIARDSGSLTISTSELAELDHPVAARLLDFLDSINPERVAAYDWGPRRTPVSEFFSQLQIDVQDDAEDERTREILRVLKMARNNPLHYAVCVQPVLGGVTRANEWLSSRPEFALQLSVWLLHPGVVMDMLAPARAIVLASGTLSPMDPNELGVLARRAQKPMSAKHVCSSRQLIIRGLTFHQVELECKSQQLLTDRRLGFSLGRAIAALATTSPGGVLVFLPSSKHLALASQWRQLFVGKDVYVEQDFDQFHPNAVLFCKYRGQCSEGINFKDDQCRLVICVGIPFPPPEPQIIRKREYDGHNNNYTAQAFRALNQAIGRCLRHKDDYGAVILIDSRWSDPSNQRRLPTWAKLETTDNLSALTGDLKRHFDQAPAFVEIPYKQRAKL
ncbi:hypothetical protein CTAYLR_001949 [Chrysophaeum taylorii]|uniref:Helicase ATP-binding domain-containing protein n=1 Tax=Chrysophaeum taylorii TaxID=2483200 RepID=A0AAD7XG98_9STRA|nr:hypothetical protein CTAYLR_001949 [Chrysophaeum taylorii]